MHKEREIKKKKMEEKPSMRKEREIDEIMFSTGGEICLRASAVITEYSGNEGKICGRRETVLNV